MNELADRAKAGARSLLASEQRDWDAHEAELKALTKIRDDSTVDFSTIPDARGPFGEQVVFGDTRGYSEGKPLTRSQSVEGYIHVCNGREALLRYLRSRHRRSVWVVGEVEFGGRVLPSSSAGDPAGTVRAEWALRIGDVAAFEPPTGSGPRLR